jgi:SAM-dependent methyltransferase
VELLLGCGNSRAKRYTIPGMPQAWTKLVTLDIDPDCKPDILADIESPDGLPFRDDTFDEVHAYEVLEHIGQQGDYRTFFRHFGEIYRVLKPGGVLVGSSPRFDSVWAWSDPGHRRLISTMSLVFLDQTEYEKQIGKTTMTDYRWLWKGDLRVVAAVDLGGSDAWILQKHPLPATA